MQIFLIMCVNNLGTNNYSNDRCKEGTRPWNSFAKREQIEIDKNVIYLFNVWNDCMSHVRRYLGLKKHDGEFDDAQKCIVR